MDNHACHLDKAAGKLRDILEKAGYDIFMLPSNSTSIL